MHLINDSTGHGVHKIIIYNIVSHNFQFLSCFLNITHFVEISDTCLTEGRSVSIDIESQIEISCVNGF